MNLSLHCSQESTDSNSSADCGSDGQELGKKLNKCDYCDYNTNRHSNLVRHLRTMHQTVDTDQALECCEIRFVSKSHLKEHKKLFHADGYHCPVCHRPFCRRALLKRHMNVHSGRKEFCCNYCVYATSHKSNLERHCQRLHGLDFSIKSATQVKGVRAAGSDADGMDVGDELESSCEDSRFQKPRLCSQPYQCPSCEKAFHSQIECTKHSEVCFWSQSTSADESVVLAALALTQLKYGSSFT